MKALTLIKQAEQDSSNSGFNPAYGLYGAGAVTGINAGVVGHGIKKDINYYTKHMEKVKNPESKKIYEEIINENKPKLKTPIGVAIGAAGLIGSGAYLQHKQKQQGKEQKGSNIPSLIYGAGAAAGIGTGVMYHNSAKEHKESQQKEIDMQQKKITGYKQELQKAQNELDESLKKYNTPLGDIPTKIHQVQRDRDAVYDQIDKAKEKVENGGDRKELDELINKEKEMTKQVAHLQDGEFFHQVSKPAIKDTIKGNEGLINMANSRIEQTKNSKPYIKLHTKLLGAGAIGLLGAGAYLQHRQNQNKG